MNGRYNRIFEFNPRSKDDDKTQVEIKCRSCGRLFTAIVTLEDVIRATYPIKCKGCE